MANSNLKIIYTLSLHVRLEMMGFHYITEMRNPKKPTLNCWVYEATPEFLQAFDAIIRGENEHD